jgi:CRISPR/Cas system CSM-associated protein Csm3 (group 7 of RAMP superfamily)
MNREERKERLRSDETYRDVSAIDQRTGRRYWEYYIVKQLGEPKKEKVNIYHDVFAQRNGRLSLTIETKSQIFIGSGTVEITGGDQQYFTFSRVNNEIIIPGSSLKGDIRQYAEALSFSCFEASCENELCPACRIFGSASFHFKGKVSFEDAKLLKGKTRIITIPQRWGPRIEYENGRKFYYHSAPLIESPDREWLEVVEAGSYFNFNLAFENLEDWELGLLILAMGVAPGKEFPLKIGGGKNRGLGLVKLSLELDRSFLFLSSEEMFSSPRPKAIKVKEENLNNWVEKYLEKMSSGTREELDKIIKKFREGKPDGQR